MKLKRFIIKREIPAEIEKGKNIDFDLMRGLYGSENKSMHVVTSSSASLCAFSSSPLSPS